ncbi:MAG: Na+/H+ antiporter subunit E [Candidatus Omnitrophica bacterium]|jgi:multicomponent Na+:H+ antiporter subunit E|nr:Na+/H+ antiporter subunit E [Candidatus Omnitrophota bacterium]
MTRTSSRIITFFVALIIWHILSWDLSWVTTAVGSVIAILVSFISGHLFTDSPNKWIEPKRYLYFLLYCFTFLEECFKANIDVALRVIKPNMPINPGIVKVKTHLKTETALTFLANSITLTPGTLSVDIDDKRGIIYIHWIDVKNKDIVEATNIIVRRFENIIEKVFE